MIPLIKPTLPSAEKWTKYLQMSYNLSYFSNQGPCASLLEERIMDLSEIKTLPILVSNATTGLISVIKALGLKGCEILVPSFTFAATALAITNTENIPVFVDIDKDWFLSIEDAESKITSNTKAMIVVHTLGAIPDSDKYEAFALKHNLRLIFDAATTFGLSYPNQSKVGTAGDAEVFSFHATKTFGVGEGGLISSRNSELMARARSIINFGFDEDNNVSAHGFNGKMSELPAAVGLAVLDELPSRFVKRNKIASLYQKRLRNNTELKIYDTPARQMMVVAFEENKTREAIREIFKEKEIGCRVYYSPLHLHTFFKRDMTLPMTEEVFSKCLSIPMWEGMTTAEIDVIVRILNGGFHE